MRKEMNRIDPAQLADENLENTTSIDSLLLRGCPGRYAVEVEAKRAANPIPRPTKV